MSRNVEEEDRGGDQREALRVEIQDPNLEEGRWEPINSSQIGLVWLDDNTQSLMMKSNIREPYVAEVVIRGLCSILSQDPSPSARILGQTIEESIQEYYAELSK